MNPLCFVFRSSYLQTYTEASAVSLAPLNAAVSPASSEAACCCLLASQPVENASSSDSLHIASIAEEILEVFCLPYTLVVCGHHLGPEGLDSRPVTAQHPANVQLMDSVYLYADSSDPLFPLLVCFRECCVPAHGPLRHSRCSTMLTKLENERSLLNPKVTDIRKT